MNLELSRLQFLEILCIMHYNKLCYKMDRTEKPEVLREFFNENKAKTPVKSKR